MEAIADRNQMIDRRSLIAGTVATTAAVVGNSEAATPRTNWNAEYDIVIVGFGVASCSAAIEALDVRPDAKILILEKAPEEHAGGNSRASGQGLVIAKDKEAMKRYQRNLGYSNPVPEDLLEFWANELMELHPWIQERAKEAKQEYFVSEPIYEFADLGAREAVKNQATILPRPGGLWEAFKKNIDMRPVTVWYDSPAVDLVQDCESGEVFGVIVERGGQKAAVKANGGVVMACGGYENNDDMKRNYAGWADVHAFGSPYNTGDGIHILQRAGADLWHLRNRMNSGTLLSRCPNTRQRLCARLTTLAIAGSKWLPMTGVSATKPSLSAGRTISGSNTAITSTPCMPGSCRCTCSSTRVFARTIVSV